MTERQFSVKRKAKSLHELVQRAQKRAVTNILGLYKRPGEPGYNSDADSTWNECRVVTRCSLALVQGTMAAERAKQVAEAPRLLGVVAVPLRIESAKEWEAFATQPVERPALEAVAVESKDREP